MMQGGRHVDPVTCHFDGTPADESEIGTCYARMSIRLCVERQAEFTIFNVIMPNFMLTICQMMSFAINRADVGDRLAYHITVLLAMFAGKLITVGMLPIVSYLTFIDWYLFASYIFVVLIAGEVSVVTLLVDLPPGVQIEEADLRTTDQTSFFVFLSVWVLYHLAFTAMGVYIRRRNRARMLGWLREAIAFQDRIAMK